MMNNKISKVLVITMILILLISTTVFGAAISKKIEVYYNGIKLVVDGVPVDDLGKDGAGNAIEPFIYNGTTYLPVRAVGQALGKQVNWDGSTNTVLIGDSKTTGLPDVMLKTLNTYNSQTYGIDYEKWNSNSSTKTTEKAADGNTYENSVNLCAQNHVYAYSKYKHEFLLNQKYSRFTTDYILSDYNKNTTFQFYLKVYGDDKLLYSSEKLSAGFIPQSIDIDVSHVIKLTFMIENADSDYGFNSTKMFNVILTNPGLYN